ncbi:hypothetical protein DLAC_09128 [Tieghemostelium lacteum]|uniref:Uncharacterized protein n=1 Tax=Tieghemostelium lacteum TaxID=361077 RepID=A0A151Z972_TIELA|nr:hypothetical protein DLAC_09128 [Tieghemostelium lacteum]|eukprot:KYQ90501.1 hypothetical protein DLAC_09128 [Tieghemostelium lacteum]
MESEFSNLIKENNNNINSDDEKEEEYIKQKQIEIDSIQQHYSTEEELLLFEIKNTKNLIEKLESSNIELALAYQDDPDPEYESAITENLAIIDKRNKTLKHLQTLLLQKQDSMYL